MNFSGKMCFMIILKVTKKQGFTLSLEDIFFSKKYKGGSICLPPTVILGLRENGKTHRRMVRPTGVEPSTAEVFLQLQLPYHRLQRGLNLKIA